VATPAAPNTSTIAALARAFDCSSAYLLPGWDGLTSLTVHRDSPAACEALRPVSDLDEEGALAPLLAAPSSPRPRGARRGAAIHPLRPLTYRELLP